MEITNKMAKEQIDNNSKKAKESLKNKDQLEKILQEVEKVLKDIPFIGNQLSDVIVMISMVKSYVQGSYKEIPVSIIIAIIGALIYLITPMDLIPDFILGIGYIDDIGVLSACWKMASSDLNKYKKWRKANGKEED